MKKFPILLLFLLVASQLSSLAQNAIVPSSEYFTGKWEIRTHGYNFKKDGTLVVFNPDDGSKLDEGTWNLDGDKVVIKTSSVGVQSVKFRIVSKDSWEWISTKDRIWDATRLK